MKKQRNKRAFTLLEIIICVVLLSLVSTLFGYKAKDLFSTYSFKQDIKKIENYLHVSRHFATLYQADVSIIFSKTKKGVEMSFYTDEPSLEGNKLLGSSYVFTTIKEISFLQENQKEDQIQILFSASNWIFPLKDLEITSKEGKKVLVHLCQNLSLQAQ